MPNYRVTIEGRTYDVQVPDPGERPVRAIVDGQIFEVHVQPEALPGAAPAVVAVEPSPTPVAPLPAPERAQPMPVASLVAAPSSGGGTVDVTAPLPGTIVSVSVAAGDTVAYGQELCVLEAMKMNNPIRSTHAGQVTKVLVSVGQQVQHGAPLLVIAEA